MAGITENSPLIALRNAGFRHLWLASLLAGTCVTAQDCAAVWAMYKLNSSPLFLSLMSAAAALPFFLFILPAGALADVMDRRKLLCVMSFWSTLSAGLLGALSGLRLLSPYLILLCVFLIGVGLAIAAPIWPALASEMVSKEELPSATVLGGLQLNIGAILGPSVGGVLLPIIGTKWICALSAFCLLLVAVALLLWQRKTAPSKLPLENFLESFFTAIRYVKHAAGIQVILIRSAVFTFFISLIPAIIPVINAAFFIVTQGAMVLGGIIWGTAAATFVPAHTLISGSILLFLSVLIAIPLSINFTRALDLTPVPVTGFSHKLLYLPSADDGPVVIHYDIEVDRMRGREFLETMKHVRKVYLRNGAFSWRLHEDLGRYNTYRIEIMVPSWSQHLAQSERLTKAEKMLLERARNFHVGNTAPEEQMFLCVNRELLSRRPLARNVRVAS